MADERRSSTDSVRKWRREHPEEYAAQKKRDYLKERARNGVTKEYAPKRHKLELAGHRFGRLSVIGFSGIDKRHYTLWECKCDCGNTKIVKGLNLRLGTTQSCGCIQREMYVARGRKAFSSGRLRQGIPDPTESGFRSVLRTYRHGAKRRNLLWNLSDEEFRAITSAPCFYTGLMPATPVEGWTGEIYVCNGIDRIDNSLGYFKENCVPCNPVVNRMKSNLSSEQFLTICRLIARRHPPQQTAPENDAQFALDFLTQ